MHVCMHLQWQHPHGCSCGQPRPAAPTCTTPVYCFWLPWICIRILSRSSGATDVRLLQHGSAAVGR